MESLAVLRQLIGQIQEFWDVFGSRPHHERWCFLDIENSSTDDTHSSTRRVRTSSSLKMVGDSKPPPSKRSRRERNHERNKDKVQSEPMEEQIWKDFPEDLFEAVIARLPIATFFRFRSVCRKWNSLLGAQSFSLQCAQVPQRLPWFYTITHENTNAGAIYDPSLKKWHHTTTPPLPSRAITLPVTSAGGLVCFLDIGHRNFYVCNPLTRSFKELPSRSVRVWSRVAVGMILNEGDTSYKILWLGCNGDFEVFDSISNTWARSGSMPTDIKIPLALNFRSQAVSIGGSLYFMRTNPDGLVIYDSNIGAWQQLVIPPPPQATDLVLAQCGSRIMLVGLLSRNAATCVCVWELQRMTLLWKEVDRMPNIMCLEFYGKQVRMSCLGNRGLVLLSLRSRQLNRLVVYDVERREWSKVPACVLPRGGRKRQWIACGTSFRPCLTASA
ncbi:F-box only protein 6 isoform X2 [Amborella trichopoda]|uniref:F-box only protein 6 isoform X2 n=1 Tax=Amborella trichopoda TaxID=13333 RepID=UPI0005D41A87|nr:F-box only protein 6 isoform X2 [Amborella trichopoda]|eukprot:XP_006848250.2 F-box only protein 6 isoform X2 [Amborella trichopoda]